MKVWVPDGFDRGGLPDDVEIGLWFGDPAGVELVVPDRGGDDVFAALSELPDLRVVQEPVKEVGTSGCGRQYFAGSVAAPWSIPR